MGLSMGPLQLDLEGVGVGGSQSLGCVSGYYSNRKIENEMSHERCPMSSLEMSSSSSHSGKKKCAGPSVPITPVDSVSKMCMWHVGEGES